LNLGVSGRELRANVEVGKEVIDCLSEDASPVNGVNGAEVMFRVKFAISEERFYNVLCK
jgi:hypothetical protein